MREIVNAIYVGAYVYTIQYITSSSVDCDLAVNALTSQSVMSHSINVVGLICGL